jgi:geranylgeranyl transferase type-2 subunit alpha
MHGRKRVSISEAQRIKQQQRANSIRDSIEQVMQARQTPETSAAFIAGPTAILDTLEDFASVWNMRKSAFEAEPSPEALQKELSIAARVLHARNPKAYWAWHHRRWCTERVAEYDFSAEVDLADEFLRLDPRNFHAWRHRRWAVAKCPDLVGREKARSYELISNDIANFSAWHYRSQLPVEFDLEEEVDIAKNAFWTMPEEQSSWIYYRWLLNRPGVTGNKEFLEKEIETMREMVESVSETKYPLLALVWLLRKLPDPDEEEIARLKEKLAAIDPVRAPYYREL